MSAKKWFLMLGATLLLLAVLLALFNFIVDPFGVFGDRFFTWWSADMTNNPRAAKIGYLESVGYPYDSYVIGCSSTSSFPVEALNRYYDANFYNLIMYGADMQVTEDTVRHLFETTEVRHLVLNVYIDNGIHCASGARDITYYSHEKVSGESPLRFYARYLFADPRYALSKLKNLRQDTYLQQSFDVFNVQTGAYDKSLRDIEPIGEMSAYLQDYPVFANYPRQSGLTLSATDDCMACIERIQALCDEHGASLLVVTAPVYIDYFANFSEEDVRYFYTRLAETTPFWDFSLSSVSCEPRYFYDDTHFRNCVGEMAFARIFGGDIYIPDDFGVYVTAENVGARIEEILRGVTENTRTAQVPILMYHHLAEEGEGTVTISAARFEEQMRALSEAGYTALRMEDLQAFVLRGEALPEKSVVITFDDGYESNYTLAYPILQKYGMHATIFAIGTSVGKDTYKDTGQAMTPHFTYEQAAEMVRSGLISVQSHGYDVHQVEGLDEPPLRQGVGMLHGEREEDYIAFFREDFNRSRQALEEATGEPVYVFAYPYGKEDDLTAVLLSELGVTITMGDTTGGGINTLVAGLPQTLYGLKRLNVDDSYSGKKLLEAIAPALES